MDGSARSTSPYVGIGLYSVPEAARLSGVPAQRIRRWFFGYKYRGRDGGMHETPSLWRGDAPRADDTVGLSFLDLMEVRMVDAFRHHRLKWRVIKEAAAYACELYDDRHPFTMKKFLTDGNRIFAEAISGDDAKLLDLNRRQYVSQQIVQRTLFEGVEFEHGQAARWYPKEGRRRVVVDPDRAFGRPVLAREGVPTEVLAKAAQVEGSPEAAARWYGVSVSSVRVALAFEERLAA